MYFEGSEKKLTLTINHHNISLLNDFDDSFWQQLVEQCQAKILSKITNQQCTAYLLSESSLFIWDDHFVLITCGRTNLVSAINFFIKAVKPSDINQLIFQRKNEYFSYAQPSNFFEDIKQLQQNFNGCAARFGALDSHHNYLYHLTKTSNENLVNSSYEFLAYQISPEASEFLCQPNLTVMQVREFLQLNTILQGFQVDDFLFSPFGYSLNAINGEKYLTIHITPQQNSSYVSVESNLNLLSITPHFLSLLQPASFDLIAFNQAEFSELNNHYIPKNYLIKEQVESRLCSNELVNFANYIQPMATKIAPYTIDI